MTTATPTRVWPKPIVHIYESSSRGREGTVYRVLAWHGVYECDCPARVECKHIKQQREADLADLAYLQEIGAMNTIQETGLVPVRTPELGAALVTQDQLNNYRELAKQFVKATGMVPQGMTEDQAVAIVLAGHELGFPPAAALRQMFPVNGKIQMMTEGWVALVLDRDPTARFVWHDIGEAGADVELQRNGRSVIRVKYTDAERVRAHQGYRKKGEWSQAQGSNRRYFRADKDRDGNYIWLEDPDSPWNTHRADMHAWAAAKRCVKFGAPDLVNLSPRDVRYHVIDDSQIAQGEVSKAVFAGSVKMEDLDDDAMPAAEWRELDDNDGIPPDDGAPPIEEEQPQQESASVSSGAAPEDRPAPVSPPPAAASPSGSQIEPSDEEPENEPPAKSPAERRATLDRLLTDTKQSFGDAYLQIFKNLSQFMPDGKARFTLAGVPDERLEACIAWVYEQRGEPPM